MPLTPPMPMLELALHYALELGWRVFPVEPKGKQPIGRLVPHGLKDATTDEGVIRRWWGIEPEANVGLPTGVAFDVADLDSTAALTRFQESCREHDVDPRKLPRAKTGGGGRHVFVRPTGFGNRAKLLPGMDWRGKGGYVVAAGSVHESGESYAWLSKPKGEFPPCPEWLLDVLSQQNKTAANLKAPQAPRGEAGRPNERYLAAAYGGALGALEAATEGERNDQLNRAAFSIGQMVAAGWVPEHMAERDLTEAARRVGLDDAEIRATIRSGLESGKQDPRAPVAQESGGRILHGRFQAAPQGTPEGDAPEQPDLSAFEELIEPGPIWAQRAGEQVPALIRGFLVAGGLGMLISDPKAGKTWLTLELVVSIVTGTPAFGRYAVEQRGRVLYIATEGTREGTLTRLAALSRGHGADVDTVLNSIDFIWRRGVRLDDAPFASFLLDRAADYTLIVVDVLAEAWNGDENRANEVSQLMRHVRPLTDAGATVLLLHHLNKLQDNDLRSIWQRIRGSTALFGAFDSGIGLERAASAERTKVSFQHRDDAPLQPFTFTWPDYEVDREDAVTLDWRPVDETRAKVLGAEEKVLRYVAANPGKTRRDLERARAGGDPQSTRMAVLALVASRQLMEKETTVPAANGIRLRTEIHPVALSHDAAVTEHDGATFQGEFSSVTKRHVTEHDGANEPSRTRGAARAGFVHTKPVTELTEQKNAPVNERAAGSVVAASRAANGAAAEEDVSVCPGHIRGGVLGCMRHGRSADANGLCLVSGLPVLAPEGGRA